MGTRPKILQRLSSQRSCQSSLRTASRFLFPLWGWHSYEDKAGSKHHRIGNNQSKGSAEKTRIESQERQQEVLWDEPEKPSDGSNDGGQENEISRYNNGR